MGGSATIPGRPGYPPPPPFGGDEPTPTPPSPAPSSTPSPQQHAPPPPNAPQGRQNGEGGEETGQGERDEPRRVTGQGRPRSPKTVQSAEGEEGKEKRERIIVVVRSPCQENYPADAHPSALKSVLEWADPAWTRSVHLDAPGQRHGQQPGSGTADPGVVKQDKSSRGSIDTTKTRSGPQRVRMSSGERPIGAAKGKQSDTEALCQPPPPPPRSITEQSPPSLVRVARRPPGRGRERPSEEGPCTAGSGRRVLDAGWRNLMSLLAVWDGDRGGECGIVGSRLQWDRTFVVASEAMLGIVRGLGVGVACRGTRMKMRGKYWGCAGRGGECRWGRGGGMQVGGGGGSGGEDIVWGARATPAQPTSGGGCLPQPRWAVCATGAGAHQGQTSREGEKDIW